MSFIMNNWLRFSFYLLVYLPIFNGGIQLNFFSSGSKIFLLKAMRLTFPKHSIYNQYNIEWILVIFGNICLRPWYFETLTFIWYFHTFISHYTHLKLLRDKKIIFYSLTWAKFIYFSFYTWVSKVCINRPNIKTKEIIWTLLLFIIL